MIPRNIRLSEAPGFGKPIFLYDKDSEGAKKYKELTKEFILNNVTILFKSTYEKNRIEYENHKNKLLNQFYNLPEIYPRPGVALLSVYSSRTS